MNLLVTSHPLDGQFFPMLPLIDAARAAGAEVQVATRPEMGEELERRGLPWWPVGGNLAA